MAQPSAAGLCTHCILRNGTVANGFVDRIFFDCLYGEDDWIGFILQLVSISAWVVAQVPQFMDNWKNGSAEALSPVFLADWLLGDSSNLIGCLLTGTQLPLTTGTAWYFVGCDIIMIMQYIYYAASNASEARRSAQQRKRQQILNAAEDSQQHLLEYDSYNGDLVHGSAGDPDTVSQIHIVHSAPSIQSLADKGWQVHAIEDATASRLQQHVQEASTSRHPELHHDASFAVPPDPDMAGTEPGASFTLTQYLIFGLALAAMLVGALWALQQGQNRAAHSSVKGLITRPYDGWKYYASATDPGWGMHAASSESGSLPLCPEKQLPSWTQTLGLVVGYISAVAYLKSRVFQLIQNYSRGHAEGLSASMFLLAITANLTGSAGILVRIETRSELLWQLPWLVGQLGTAGMDVMIAMQASESGEGSRPISTATSVAYQQGNYSESVQDHSAEAPDDADREPLLPHTTASPDTVTSGSVRA